VCGGAGALRYTAHSEGFARAFSDARWVAEARTFVEFDYRVLRNLSVRLDAGALFPLERPTTTTPLRLASAFESSA
jgi:hypothetical protein